MVTIISPCILNDFIFILVKSYIKGVNQMFEFEAAIGKVWYHKLKTAKCSTHMLKNTLAAPYVYLIQFLVES